MGHPAPDAPFDEMSFEELQWQNTHITYAWYLAYKEGHPRAVLDVIEEDYFMVFRLLLESSSDFCKFVLGAIHRPVGGSSYSEAKARCQRMAREVLEKGFSES